MMTHRHTHRQTHDHAGIRSFLRTTYDLKMIVTDGTPLKMYTKWEILKYLFLVNKCFIFTSSKTDLVFIDWETLARILECLLSSNLNNQLII